MAKERIKKTIRPMIYIVIGCSLMWVLLSSTMNTLSRKDDIAKLEKEVAAIKKEKKELENEVELLNDDDYVTRYARENYVFTREGEQVAILPEIEDE
ncbi:MAG: septum formation initiator family protein [Faecalibacillus sp.]